MLEFRIRYGRVCGDLRMTDLRTRPATAADLDTVLAFWKVAAEGTSISDVSACTS